MKRKLLPLVLALLLLLCVACKGSRNDSGSTSTSQQYAQVPSSSSGTYYVPSSTPSYDYTPPATKVEMTCPICKGSGYRTCSSCYGTGSLQKTQYAPSFGFSSGDTSYKIDITCAACKGTGSMLCIHCGGDGKL